MTLSATTTSPSNTLFDKTYNFNAGSSGTPGTDNGTLAGVTDALDSLGLNRPNGSVNYTYDAMNRVTSAQTLGTTCTAVHGGTLNWGESFTIDPWGNLTGKTPTLCSAESLSTSATPLNQLAAATYDSAGNAYAYNGVNYIYDAEGRITSAAGTAYTYDGSSQRVSKPGKLYWRGTGSDPLAETSATDTNPTRYIFFGGKRIARIDPDTTTPKYYVSDNLGSTAVVADYLGNILSESEFYPYGGEQQVATSDTNDYKFTGKERDAESGNDYFGARYYASTLGRFLSPDWDAKPTAVPYASFGDPQTLNLYAYGENAPLNKVDADGHETSDAGVAAVDDQQINSSSGCLFGGGGPGCPATAADASYYTYLEEWQSDPTEPASQNNAQTAAEQAQQGTAQAQSSSVGDIKIPNINWAASAGSWLQQNLTVSGLGAGISAEAGLGAGDAASASGDLFLVTHPDLSEASRLFATTTGGTYSINGFQQPDEGAFVWGGSACGCFHATLGSGSEDSINGPGRVINANAGEGIDLGVTISLNGADWRHPTGIQFSINFGLGAGWSFSSFTTNTTVNRLQLP